MVLDKSFELLVFGCKLMQDLNNLGTQKQYVVTIVYHQNILLYNVRFKE